jgi:ABC-type transport system involved in multi-copper enzyme maturation permease subunit
MLSRLLPLIALFSRAVRDEVRGKFPPIIRATAALFLLLLVGINQRSFEYQAAAGQGLLMMIAMVNFFGLTLVGLGSFCSAITEEKEEETLALLRMTRLNPLAILLGKSTARFVGGLLFLAVQIPFTMLCVTLGGAARDQILRVYAVLGAYLFFLCNLGLFWSVICRRTSRAVSLTFLCGILFYIVPGFIELSLFSSRIFSGSPSASGEFGLFEWGVKFFITSNPLSDLAATVFGRLGSGLPFISNSLPFHLIGGLVFFLLSWALFDRFCSSASEAAPRKRKLTGGSANGLRMARPWQLAIAWKDFHFITGGKKGMFIRLVLYVIFIGGICAWSSNKGHLDFGDIGGFIRWSALILFTAEFLSVSTRIFGVERKRQTLGSLYLLPTSPARIAWQKFLGCALSLLPLLVLWQIGAWIQDEYVWWHRPYGFKGNDETFIVSALIIIHYLFLGTLTAYMSLRMRRAPLITALIILGASDFLSAIMIGGHRGESWMAFQTFVLGLTTFFLAVFIPGKIEDCAAAE